MPWACYLGGILGHWWNSSGALCSIVKSPVKTQCVRSTHGYAHSARCKVVMHLDRSVTSCLERRSVDDGYHHRALCSTSPPRGQAWFLTGTPARKNSLFTYANTYRSLLITISGLLWALGLVKMTNKLSIYHLGRSRPQCWLNRAILRILPLPAHDVNHPGFLW